MLRYKLNEVTTSHKATVVLPPIEPSLTNQAAYLRELRSCLREMAAFCRTDLIEAFNRQRSKDYVGDADSFTFEALNLLTAGLLRRATRVVRGIIGLESQRHTKNFMATAKRTLGVDLASVVREEDLSDYLEAAGLRNAGLIRGLLDDTVRQIQQVTLATLVSGETATTLRKRLTERFGIADRRAQLVAQDQIAKLNSDLNRIRHQQAGIESYIWTTAHDERVRSRHRQLDGKTYKYGEPTSAEEGLPPGQPIRCRCVARAIVEF